MMMCITYTYLLQSIDLISRNHSTKRSKIVKIFTKCGYTEFRAPTIFSTIVKTVKVNKRPSQSKSDLRSERETD